MTFSNELSAERSTAIGTYVFYSFHFFHISSASTLLHCATKCHPPLLQDLPIRFKASLFTYEKNKRGEFVLFVFFFYYYYYRPFLSTLVLERNFLLIMQAA